MKPYSTILPSVSLRTIILSAALVSAQVPQAIAKGDETVVGTFHAVGAQVYECKADSAKSQSAPNALTWQVREPIATLLVDGKSVGRHYAGPSWEHVDGGVAKGKVVSSTPGATPSDIAWLELELVEHAGHGIFSAATTVKRINTKGGVAQGSCEKAGDYVSVPYSADYVFLHGGK